VSGNIFEFYDIAVYTAIASYLTTAPRQIGIGNARAIVGGLSYAFWYARQASS